MVGKGSDKVKFIELVSNVSFQRDYVQRMHYENKAGDIIVKLFLNDRYGK